MGKRIGDNGPMKKVAVGLSGGVDSAVTALLLKQAGYEVTGVHLYCYPAKSEIEKDGLTREEWIKKNGCRADEDRRAALKTALELGIPFRVLDFSEEYNKRVVDYFYREYRAGRTPNPDVLCNSEIKFGLFLNWALENSFDYVATGHYALIRSGGAMEGQAKFDATFAGSLRLNIPADKHKDQTYFLWKLTQKELAHILFPLGNLLKASVRRIAKKAKLSVAERPDSQGICFIGNVDVKKLLARRLEENPGEVVDSRGEVIGGHKGLWFYTVGERGGWILSAKAQRKFVKEGRTPVFYVVHKDSQRNRLVVAEEGEERRQEFEVGEINWIGGTAPQLHGVAVRIRHGGELIKAEVSNQSSELRVWLDKPQRGVAPGQSAVFYADDEECLGGGVIR